MDFAKFKKKIFSGDSEELKTHIWRKYEKGVEYIHKIDLVARTDKAHYFYAGDQWRGLASGGEKLPLFNFIKPIIKYKVSTVAQNSMTAVYSSLEEESSDEMKRACNLLGKYFQRVWEKSKMDSVSWKIIKDAAIQGDAYLYFGEGADVSQCQIIDNVNILLGDEQSDSIQEQPYIIIRERRFVKDIIAEAKRNNISEDEIELIIADDDRDDQLGDRIEVDYESKEGKCISLLYMTKDEEGYVHTARSVKNVIYQPDSVLKCTKNGEVTDVGLKSYPVVNFLWDDKKGSGRGQGEVEFLIPNQIEVNKTLARRSIAVKQTAYPTMAYSENLVANPDDLDVIGGKIAVNNMNAQAINQIVSYLNPAQMSPDAKALSDELIDMSRELAGAGDSATGSIDPTQASGTAIIAVRDQAALPLNEQLARYSQFVEDLAYLWFDLWVCYNSDGIKVETDKEIDGMIITGYETIKPDELQQMKINVKIDVSKANPFSIYAVEQNLLNAVSSGWITFEEMVEALPEGSTMPKQKLQEIIKKRAVEEQKAQQTAQQIQGLQNENAQYSSQLEQTTAALSDAQGRLEQSRGENQVLQGQLGKTTEALGDMMERVQSGQ